ATSKDGLVTLGQVAQVVPAIEPSVIDRQDRQRQVVVGGSYQGRDVGAVAADARTAVRALDLPKGVTVKVAGQEQYTEQTAGAMGMALGMSLLFVYMILASQFASFVHPLTIMLALPFSIVGALLALFILGKPLDMMGMIGILLLLGLVTKNSILLVDLANRLRQEGRPVREALLEAGPVRLRPILMTTLAMIFGMLPLALGLGAGAELRQAMGVGVIGGLLTSTLLTLLAVPVAYSLLDDFMELLRRPRRSQPAAPDEPPAVSVAGPHGTAVAR
ncbi:MAG TPA: efflux RND transporter permease subunit, partial [Chloroflexota bacterium]